MPGLVGVVVIQSDAHCLGVLCLEMSPTGPKDERPSAPDTWTHRARNPLLFPPELETTRAICGVGLGCTAEDSDSEAKSLMAFLDVLWWSQVTAASSERLLLEGAKDETNKRIGRPPRAPKATVYSNSRFSNNAIGAQVRGACATWLCLKHDG